MSFALPDNGWLARVRRSTSFRLSMLFAVLLVIAFVAAGLGAWLVTRGIAEQQVRDRVVLEMEFIRHEAATEGMQAAIFAIESKRSRPGALAYRLTSRGGALLAGDLPIADNALGWRRLYLPMLKDQRHGEDDLMVLSNRLSDGSILSIGGDLEQGENIRIAVLRAVAWIGAVSALIAVAMGLWLTRRALRRMDALSRSLSAVAGGDLSARPTVRTPPVDDFDQLAAGVNAMLDQIAVLVANVRRVSTDVAHDLRTPLSHLRQDLERASLAEPSAVASLLQAAQSRVDGLLRTFEAMLRLAEIEAGSGRARFVRVDLGALVDRVVDAYRPDVEAAGGALVAPAPMSFPVHGDPDMLAQAVSNLIENAMTHAGASPTIHVGVTAHEGGVELVVADDGPGIGLHDRDRVLQPFFRLDASRTKGGSGLGLAIVSAIARLHGAQLLFEDALPGLRVRLRLTDPTALAVQRQRDPDEG